MPPPIPSEYISTFLDNSFQVLIERSFGQEFHTIERIRVPSIQEVLSKYGRIALLGDPGSGKSISMWKIALDCAQAARQDDRLPFPVIIELGQYNSSLSLEDWLLRKIQEIPNFSEHLKTGSLIVLLDGLNEMPKDNYSTSIEQLKHFITKYPDCKFIVTCRRLDYDKSLELQQVEIDPLNKQNIRLFISNYLRNDVETQKLYSLLASDAKLLELASNAMNLKSIVIYYLWVGKEFPRNRSRLMDGFVGALYKREQMKQTTVKFSEAEIRIKLAELAFAIHSEIGKGTYVDLDWAIQRLQLNPPKADAISLLELAKNIGLLEITGSGVRFQHQLIQEYFAALEFGKQLTDTESKKRFWIPKLSGSSTDQEDFIEPLLASETTGWEEVTIMLAGMRADASDLVSDIAQYNLVLAARCISEGGAFVLSKVHENVIENLLRMTENSNSALNTRIQAGTIIGDLGDPRFHKKAFSNGQALIPPTIRIPGGTYFIGRNKEEVSGSYSDEISRHQLDITAFLIGKYPVTNAEFDCFIKCGGYDESRYWSEQGWAWRLGKVGADLKKWFLDGYKNVRSQVLQEVERLEPRRSEDSDEMDVWWKILMEWPDEKVESELDILFEEQNGHIQTKPCYWEDPSFNRKTQPVITTWFEAQAYCKWLSDVTGRHYRLPTEVEWEAATGGSIQKYPWGNEPDTTKYNILPTRVLRTTPVGIFPGGQSKLGVYDLIGNVWEWTSSAKFPYPYISTDGRENQFLPDSRRVVRGGSWAVSESSARNSCRGNFPPDNMVRNYIGFRIACDE
jgi:formylglycine-generating enzyme required for sulfatase activity